MKHVALFAGITAAIFAPVPVHAEESDTTEKVALLSFLGLTAATGKTELGEKGGELEGWIAAGGLMGKAGCTVLRAIKAGDTCDGQTPGDKVLVLGDSEAFDFGPYLSVTSQTATLVDALKALPPNCRASRFGVMGLGEKADFGGILPSSIPSAILSLAKTDSKVTGVEIKVQERALMNAVAGMLGARAILTDGLIATKVGTIDAEWNRVRQRVTSVSTGACKDTPAAKAALALYEDTKKGFFEKGDKGSLFERARAIEPLATGTIPERVLRVRVEYAGGTIINQSNIFTTLGAPALSLSGGMIVSYRYTNGTTGTVEKAGVIICRAGVKKLHSFNNPKNPTNFGECSAV